MRRVFRVHVKARSSMKRKIMGLRSKIARAAQRAYDNWVEDEYDGGGICDEIEHQMSSILAQAGFSVTLGGQPGMDHAWTVAYDDNEAWAVDIPPGVYESGGGYSWEKIPDVRFSASDVDVYEVDREYI